MTLAVDFDQQEVNTTYMVTGKILMVTYKILCSLENFQGFQPWEALLVD